MVKIFTLCLSVKQRRRDHRLGLNILGRSTHHAHHDATEWRRSSPRGSQNSVQTDWAKYSQAQHTPCRLRCYETARILTPWQLKNVSTRPRAGKCPQTQYAPCRLLRCYGMAKILTLCQSVKQRQRDHKLGLNVLRRGTHHAHYRMTKVIPP